MSDIQPIATAVRTFLEPVWPEWHAAHGEIPVIMSRGTCARSSLFLLKVLTEDFSFPASCISGAPGTSGGYLTNGHWEGHAWVVCQDILVDITADQFGADPVVITHWPHPLYQAGKDAAFPEFRRNRIETVNALWPLWLASDERVRLHYLRMKSKNTGLQSPRPLVS